MMFSFPSFESSCVAILTAAVVAAPLSALCAGFSGVVSDETDGRPLLGATVSLHPVRMAGKTLGMATADDGSFDIENIPPGEYLVSISFVGYSTATIQLTFSSDSEQIRREIGLTPRAIDLHTISVTASRRPEKLNDAPAAVSVVGAETIQERTTLTPTDHVSNLPGVDMARTGLNQTNMVTRGFNNIFSTALLVLVDNRFARVPSLRYNAYNFIPTVDADIERIEMVSGPGSALYGPNSAAGVMHMITKSPFESEGTTVSLGGGERELMLGSFRHAGNVNNRVGYKFSGQYYEGLDWKHHEPSEPDQVAKFRPTPQGPDTVSGLVSNARDFKIKKLAGEARVDFLINENTSLIVNGGYNRGDGIELTGVSAAQAIDWAYTYFQTRFRYKDLFVQGYVNASDAGDTYLLNTGQLIVDRSRTWVAQVQHSYQPDERWSLTYGADGIFTRPNTDYTINGRNEDNDNVDEVGAYVQAEHRLSDHVKLLGAARVDDHNRLKDLVFSPRAAVVYQPDENNSLRFTYNRAYATPDINNLYLDIMQSYDPFGIGASFEPALGFRPDINVRVHGVPETGFHWRIDENGPLFRSPFAPLDPRELTTSDYIEFDDPVFTNVMWSAGRGAVRAGLQQRLTAAGLDPVTVGAMMAAVDSVTPASVAGVNNTMMTFNPDTRTFDPSDVSDIGDIDPLEPSFTQTFEIGYKGVLRDRLRFSVDAYRTKKHSFVGPLTVETPNVFLDPTTLGGYLGPQFLNNYMAEDPTTRATLDQLDNPSFGGNGNGTPVDELTTMFTSGAARIPFGTVSPEESLDPTDLLVTYRNFGDVTLYGVDLSFAYHLNRHWDIGGSYSYISKNFFAKDAEQVHDIYLNSPRNKFGLSLQYNSPKRQFEAQARLRYVDAFNMISPFIGSRVDSYVLVDLTSGIDLLADTRFTLTVQNVLDNRHIEFVGAPELGRLAIARVTQTI
ncbi:MAG: TonB-dependent receptor [Candidatus Zixiibacteriota bacterium]